MGDVRAIVGTLIRYTDGWQPATASIYQVGAARRGSGATDGLRPELLDALEDRDEARRELRKLTDRERHVLFLWYVRQLSAQDIARELRISRRQCFRIRSGALQKLQPESPDETDAA